jgi:hypothetical protein
MRGKVSREALEASIGGADVGDDGGGTCPGGSGECQHDPTC